VEYCWGNATTNWGAQRIADGHPEPFNVTTFELGNEQYNSNFVDQVAAMEARASSLGLPNTLQYMFPTNNGLNSADAARAQQMGLPIHNIMPDIHIGGGGAVEVAEGDFSALPSFPQSAINCETNAGTHTMSRAMDEALDLNDWFNTLPPVVGRLVGRAASFCMERSGHFDGFDQGIAFFLPNMTWIQPPGYVHAMISKTFAPQALYVGWASGTDKQALRARTVSSDGRVLNRRYMAGPAVSISAQKSDDNTQVFVRVANSQLTASSVSITLENFKFQPTVNVWTLSNPDPNGSNPPSNPTFISPVQSTMSWPSDGNVTVPELSYTILGFSSA